MDVKPWMQILDEAPGPPRKGVLIQHESSPLWEAKLDGDLMHMEQPTELKHITQWRKSKQLRLLQ